MYIFKNLDLDIYDCFYKTCYYFESLKDYLYNVKESFKAFLRVVLNKPIKLQKNFIWDFDTYLLEIFNAWIDEFIEQSEWINDMGDKYFEELREMSIIAKRILNGLDKDNDHKKFGKLLWKHFFTLRL